MRPLKKFYDAHFSTSHLTKHDNMQEDNSHLHIPKLWLFLGVAITFITKIYNTNSLTHLF
jgi:hypothetical protein